SRDWSSDVCSSDLSLRTLTAPCITKGILLIYCPISIRVCPSNTWTCCPSLRISSTKGASNWLPKALRSSSFMLGLHTPEDNQFGESFLLMKMARTQNQYMGPWPKLLNKQKNEL